MFFEKKTETAGRPSGKIQLRMIIFSYCPEYCLLLLETNTYKTYCFFIITAIIFRIFISDIAENKHIFKY